MTDQSMRTDKQIQYRFEDRFTTEKYNAGFRVFLETMTKNSSHEALMFFGLDFLEGLDQLTFFGMLVWFAGRLGCELTVK